VVHLPPAHTFPVGQLLAQVPQWFGSLFMSTQEPPHDVKPPRQVAAQRPDWQPTIAFIIGVHAAPQAPQLALSFSGSTQARPQATNPVSHFDVLEAPSFGGGDDPAGGGVAVAGGEAAVSEGPGSVVAGGRAPPPSTKTVGSPSEGALLEGLWPLSEVVVSFDDRTQVFVWTSHV
jgi:hypothetical protein